MPSFCKSVSNAERSVVAHHRFGLTLIEILIALTMTLIVLGAMMSAFQYASAEMQNGRAMLEMSNRARVVENLLRRDLANLTVEPRPYIGKVIPNGYFEYIEGPRRDMQPPFGIDTDNDGVPNSLDNNPGTPTITGLGIQPFFDYPVDSAVFPDRPNYQPRDPRNPESSYLGDVDDILAMTIRSIAGQTFRGRLSNFPTSTASTIVESAFAEVVWWTVFTDSNDDQNVSYDENVTVFRRVLIINPDVTLPTALTTAPGVSYVNAMKWMAASDISARIVEVVNGSGTITGFNVAPNSLQDLSNRANRFARRHDGGSNFHYRFPFPINRGTLLAIRSADLNAAGDRVFNGNDIVLSDVASFDVKVFSPDAVTITDPSVPGSDGVMLEPSAPAYATRYIAGGGAIHPFSTAATVTGGPDTSPADGRDDRALATGAFVDLGHYGTGQFAHPVTYDSDPGSGVNLSPTGWFVPGQSSINVPRTKLYSQYNFHLVGFTAADAAPTMNNLPPLLAGLLDSSYDTWTPIYENDGLNQDPGVSSTYVPATNTPGVLSVFGGAGNQTTDAEIDEGTDGIDNDGANGPDDFNERETQPPYNHPIRGLKVTIRLVEKQTGQVRQSSVVQNYNVQ